MIPIKGLHTPSLVYKPLVRKWVDQPRSEGEMTGTGNQTYGAAVEELKRLSRKSNRDDGLSPEEEARRQMLDRLVVDREREREQAIGAASSTACCGN
jgi:hypothetical protein